MAYITTLGGPCMGVLQLTGTNPTLVNTGNSSTQTTPSFGYTRSLQFQIGTGATAYYVDTLHNTCVSIPSSGGGTTADTLTLSALVGTQTPTARYDVLGQVTPIYARVRAILIELLTTGDVAGNSGLTPNASASITLGNAAANAWNAIILSTGTISVQNAASFAMLSRSAAGFVVSSGSSDQLKILNPSTTLAAIYQIVLFGGST